MSEARAPRGRRRRLPSRSGLRGRGRAFLRGLALALGVVAPLGAAGAAPDAPESARAGVAHGGAGREPRAELTLLAEAVQARPGERVRVGVLFELESGWHMYWRHSGESGLPTEIAWSLDGVPLDPGPASSVGPLRWPAPSVFRESDGFITTYGYSGEVLLFVDLDVPDGSSGEIVLGASADLLVCEIQCIPGKAELSRVLRIGDERVPADGETRELFDAYEARVPVPAEQAGVELEALYSQSAIRPGDRFRAGIAVTACAKDSEDCEAYEVGTRRAADAFVPEAIPGVVKLRTTGSRPHPFVEGGLVVTLEGEAAKDEVDAKSGLRGALWLDGPSGPVWVDVDLELPRASEGSPVTELEAAAGWLEPLPQAPASSPASIGRALLLALLGGMILNLMPCVFPVLAIKLFALAELAHAGRARSLGQGVAYTSGILATMGLLALLVIALRAAGTAVGWGFQFQEPLFVLAVGGVLVVFALNLFGAFEIAPDLTRVSRIGAGATGNARSFFEGLLAVVLATPCSAPFLGAAVGFAFASPPIVILATFLTIGLGLAAPYLLVTCVPGWAGAFPRPGPWMLHLRTGLGFALLGTVVWLVWILGSAAGVDAAVAGLGFWLALALGTWLYGVAQAAGRRNLARGLAIGVLAVLLGVSARLPLTAAVADGGVAGAESSGGFAARPFDRDGVRASLAAGAPVFVYFTADWCLTCKVNERLVFEDDGVQAELRALGFDVFVGDWTRRDEEIRAELARFGRAAVPMYLVYDPRKPEAPELLPELLTVDTFVTALRRAAAPPPRADHPGGRSS